MKKQKLFPYLPKSGATGTEDNNSPIYQATNDCKEHKSTRHLKTHRCKVMHVKISVLYGHIQNIKNTCTNF